MITRLLLVSILLSMAASASAIERILVSFELRQGESKVEWGQAFVSHKQKTWSKGLKRSYLKLHCKQQESGKTQKMYSTVDHFSGLRVIHQLVEGNIDLTVVRTVVQPRLIEIRALARAECKDLSPIITTTTETYSFDVKDPGNVPRSFGENMTFRATLQSLGGGS